jgi:hypothetical protein
MRIPLTKEIRVTTTAAVTGTIPAIIRNDAGLYEGDLCEYFRILFSKARNLRAPYHNARHMLHVLYMCHEAVCYYSRIGLPIHPGDARNLLIAAMFHDFDHTARGGNDDLNIQFALRGLEAHILKEDAPYLDMIKMIISLTQYPYKVETRDIDILGQILRDADMSQAMSSAWIQQVVFGLAEEWGKPAMEVLRMQVGFHRGLVFYTAWGKSMFTQEMINSKIAEAEELVAILGV